MAWELDQFSEESETADLDAWATPVDDVVEAVIPEKQASEEAFYASALSNDSNLWDKYYRIKGELQNKGSSQEYEDVKSFIHANATDRRKKLLEDQLSSPAITTSEAETLVQSFLIERGGDVDLADEYVQGLIESRVTDTPQDVVKRKTDLSFIRESLNSSSIIETEMNRSIAQYNTNVGTSLFGFIQMLTPFLEGAIVNTAHNAAMGGQGNWDQFWNLILTGEAKEDFRQAMKQLPPSQRIEAAKRAIEAVSDLPYVTDFNKLFPLVDLVGSNDPHVAFRAVDNIVGVLDATFVGAGIGKAVSMGIKGAKSTKPLIKPGSRIMAKPQVHPASVLGKTAHGDIDSAGKIAAKVINDETDEMAKAVGVTKDEVIFDYALPKAAGEILSEVPVGMADEINAIHQTGRDIAREASTTGINYTDAEKSAAQEIVRESIDDATKLFIHQRQISDIDETYTGIAIYGNKKKGLPSYEAAEKRGAKDFGKDVDIQIFTKDPITKEFIPAVKSEDFTIKAPSKVKMILDSERTVDVDATLKLLPKVEDGLTRLYRAESPTIKFEDVFNADALKEFNPQGKKGQFYTDDISYADYFRLTYGRDAEVKYIDVPTNSLSAVKTPDGFVIDVAKPIKPTGEHFIGVKFSHGYNAMDAAVYGQSAVSKGLFGFIKSGYAQDIVSRFDRFISQSFLSADRKGGAYEKRLLDTVRKDLDGLNNKARVRLFDALEAGSREEKVWSQADLGQTFKMNKKEIEAYYKFRAAEDVAWGLTNQIERQRLASKDLGQVNNVETGFSAFSKEIEDLHNVNTIYNPSTGLIHAFDDTFKEVMRGGKVHVMESPKRVGSEYTRYVFVDDAGTKAGRLPDHVVPYRDGYYSRSYKETHFVDIIPTSAKVNGKALTLEGNGIDIRKLGNTIAAFKSKTEADRHIKDLIETGKYGDGVVLESRRGKEFDFEKSASATSYDIHANSMRSAKKRNERLAGHADNGKANIEDPVESLFGTMRALSSKMATQDLLASSKARWEKSFGDYVEGGGYPARMDQIQRKHFPDNKSYSDAKALFELTQTIERVPGELTQKWKNLIFNFSEDMEHIFLPLGKGIRTVGLELNPIRTARQMASTAFISLRPLRQLLVQSGQLMQFTFINPKYMATSFSRELAGLSFVRTTWNAKDPAVRAMGQKVGAKMFGVTEDEFKIISDTYMNKSGLPYSVDANVFVEGLVKDIHKDIVGSAPKRAAAAVAKPFKQVAKLSRQAGFDAGEFLNLSGSWLIARRKWMDANPKQAGKWMDKANADRIASHATEISYAMTQSGTFKYQRGLLSLPLQFIAVPHKALLSVLPEFAGGSKAFTASDKVRLAAANLTLFGGYAFGLNQAFNLIQEEAGFDIPEDLLLALKGGMFDWGANKLIRSMDPEAPAVQLSKSHSPFSGGIVPFIPDLAEAIMKGDLEKIILGPSYNLIHIQKGRFATAMRDVTMMGNAPSLSTEEEILYSIGAIASVASGVDDYFKARYAIKMGKLISSKGSASFSATTSTALAKLFGYTTYQESDAWEILREIGDDDKAFKQGVKSQYESMMRINKKYLNRKEWKHQMDGMRSVLASLDDAEKNRYIEELVRLDRQSLKDIGESLFGKILQRATNGGEIREDIINKVKGNLALGPEQQKKLLELLDKGVDEKTFTGDE